MSASAPRTARPNSSTFSGPMPARKSRPSARVRGDAGHRGGREAAARQQRGAGERVRAAAGEADRHVLAGAERVEHRGGVRDDVGDACGRAAAWSPRSRACAACTTRRPRSAAAFAEPGVEHQAARAFPRAPPGGARPPGPPSGTRCPGRPRVGPGRRCVCHGEASAYVAADPMAAARRRAGAAGWLLAGVGVDAAGVDEDGGAPLRRASPGRRCRSRRGCRPPR